MSEKTCFMMQNELFERDGYWFLRAGFRVRALGRLPDPSRVAFLKAWARDHGCSFLPGGKPAIALSGQRTRRMPC